MPPPDAPTDAADFRDARALHPASVVLGIPARQLVQGVLFPAVVGASAGPGLRFAAVIVAVLLVVTFVVRLVAWRRFRFSFDGAVLRVDEGVLSRNHRSLDVDRIQQVEIERSLLARVLGLAALRVETAGGDSEVALRVLPEDDAHALRDAVRASKAARSGTGTSPSATADGEAAAGDAPSTPSERTVLHVPARRVVLAAVTGSQLLVLPALLAAATQFLGDGDAGGVDATAVVRQALQLGVVALVALAIPAALAVAIATGVLRDHDWTLSRVDDDLRVHRGLLSRRESVVPLHRVQLVEVQRNWIRRALGYATVRVHSAGGGSGGDADRVSVPLLHRDEVDALLTEVLPGVPGVPELVRHPAAARRRSLFRWMRDSLLVAVPLWVVPRFAAPELTGRLALVGAAVVVLAAAMAIVEYRQLATGWTDRVAASRRGALTVTTGVAPLVKVQGASTRASWFQRRLGLVTVTAHVAGPGGDLGALDLGRDTGQQLHRHLAAAAADPIVPDELAEAPELSPDPSGTPSTR